MKRIAVALLALCLACGCAAKPATIRVLSYNIHHGEGVDRKLDLPRIAAVITSANPDLVALQEVDRGVERSGRVDQPGRLGELTGMQPVFEKNINYQGGEYGNAVLSRLPVLRHENHALPQSIPGEQRGLLEVRVSAAGRELIFCATHFDYHASEGERLASADMFRSLAANWGPAPYILVGDLNAKPESETLSRLLDFMDDSCLAPCPALTFPAEKPDRRIDYILYKRDPRLRCLEYRVLEEPVASDHRPILAVLELRG